MTSSPADATLSSVKRILVAAMALVCIACGGESAEEASPTASVSPSASPGATATPAASPSPALPLTPGIQLIVANSTEAHLSLVNPGSGKVEARLEVGPAPWGIATRGGVAWVSTATSLVAVDTLQGRLLVTLPLQAKLAAPSEGEYREGGMGIAMSPDGERVFVAVYTAGGSFLEVFHTRNGYERSIPVGVRPFDVVVAPSGRTVYSIDHDSYALTAVDTQTWQARTIEVAPIGRGAFDKPHYGAVAGNELLLPYQGQTLLAFNLESGATRQMPLTANTHQHGIAITSDGGTAVIVGTGPAGGASGSPSLTVLNLSTGAERIIPLSRPHELVALSADGKTAFLSGGYLLGGWDGVTVVDLASGQTRELSVPEKPLGIIVVAR